MLRRIAKGPPFRTPYPSVPAMFYAAAKAHALEPAFAWREGTHVRELSYAEVESRVRDLAAGLVAEGVRQGDRVAILADTRMEWGLADLAIQSVGGVTTTIFTTLAPEQIGFLLADAGVRVAFVENVALFGKIRRAGDGVAGVESWFAMEPQPPQDDAVGRRTRAMEELAAAGRAHLAVHPRAVDERVAALAPDDASTIIYTSGTTGVPKGVVLTHQNCVSSARMPTQAFRLDEYDRRRTVVFLPLAHSLTRGVFLNAIDLGARIGFSGPRTLVDDQRAMRPRLIASAPRIYERIHDQFLATAASAPPLRRKLMERARAVAIAYGAAVSDGKRAPPGLAIERAVFDRLVYSKLRHKVGWDDLDLALSGAAAIRAELLHFFRGAGILIVEAWGLTETCAPGTTNPLDRVRPGTVGLPFPGVEVALDEDGEILVAGPNVFRGYHRRPEEDKEAFVVIDGKRWFRTGDLGEFDEAGYLRIVDRKKELEVLDTGKKIAPISVEETLKTVSPMVGEACLIGTGRKYAAALVQPNLDRLVAWARQQKIPFDEKAIEIRPDPTGTPMTYSVGVDLVRHPRVVELYEGEVAKANERVADFERIRAFRLVPHVFSIDRDELTMTLKKKRRVIKEHYAAEIEQMFK